MTGRQLGKLVGAWQAAFGLHEWRVEVVLADLNDRKAEVDYLTTKRWATITFDRKLAREWSEEEASRTVVHELLHLMLVPYTGTAEKLHGHKGKAGEVFRQALLLNEEVVVDRLTNAIVR